MEAHRENAVFEPRQQYWKDGNIPDIARKHDLIQDLIEELYPSLIA